MAFCFGHHRGVNMSGKQSKRNRKRQSQQTFPRLDAVYGNVRENVTSLTVTIDALVRICIPEIDPASIQRRLTYLKTTNIPLVRSRCKRLLLVVICLIPKASGYGGDMGRKKPMVHKWYELKLGYQ